MPRNASRTTATKPAAKAKSTKKASAKPAAQSASKKSAAKKPNVAAIAAKVVKHLADDYPEVTCALENESAFELLVATILSAQCTDERVNMVTPDLFRRWPTPPTLAAAPIEQLEKAIQSTGFFRNKAKNIKACSRELVDKHGGEVPRDLDAAGRRSPASAARRPTSCSAPPSAWRPASWSTPTSGGLSHRLGLTQTHRRR